MAIIKEDGSCYDMLGAIATVGRSKDGTIELRHRTESGLECESLEVKSGYVSYKHCTFRQIDDLWYISDDKSDNGTWVSGKKGGWLRPYVLHPLEPNTLILLSKGPRCSIKLMWIKQCGETINTEAMLTGWPKVVPKGPEPASCDIPTDHTVREVYEAQPDSWPEFFTHVFNTVVKRCGTPGILLLLSIAVAILVIWINTNG